MLSAEKVFHFNSIKKQIKFTKHARGDITAIVTFQYHFAKRLSLIPISAMLSKYLFIPYDHDTKTSYKKISYIYIHMCTYI